jgi:hypothetical protein
MRALINTYNILVGISEGKKQLENQGINSMVVLKQVFFK